MKALIQRKQLLIFSKELDYEFIQVIREVEGKNDIKY